ncbi:hypothetical protein [Polaribacter porphyrae]|uniref:Haem-binding uptake Tiki superfamily ChaN domain-containing protein n=1 Tax=Polaribacter porphyrae TaxID=1137780 RepID=A0A2S7WLW9_9FLAO|nr:hypothetical protein [Polaribacter porphyrae]PQJ78604.1 hypothetical protein BTO18_05115 [Polaribacter porphyrae]
MKKILLGFLLIPFTMSLLAIVKYNIQLNNFIDDVKYETQENKNIDQQNKTEVYILGTLHFETEKLKRHHFYNRIDSISPDIILYEGIESTVKRMVKRTDFIAQLMNAFKKEKKIESAVVLKYLDKNLDCKVLPYEWEIRDKYHRKYKLRKNSKNMINGVLKLYSNKLLNEEETAVIDSFLVINKSLVTIDNNPTINKINNLKTDSILRKRQNYIYNKIPKIARNRKELKKYFDFIPFHESYWDTRNKAMAQNILNHIKLNPNKKIIVLNGFYHRYYLIDELKKYELYYSFRLMF